MEAVFIFPHQLFEDHPSLKKDRPVFLIEDPRFFSDFSFHKKKLILHRASLKGFEKRLKKRGFKTHYVETGPELIFKTFSISSVYAVEFDDFVLEQKMKRLAQKNKVKLTLDRSPGFLTSPDEFVKFFKGKNRFNCQSFYIDQRKRLGILLDRDQRPLGGQWSFDVDNRKKAPKGLKIPRPPVWTCSSEVKEAIAYVQKKYPSNPGSAEGFNYPTTHSVAKKALSRFLTDRLAGFGTYEDAIVQDEELLFHSCLSPLLNIGLLTPAQVLEETFQCSAKKKIPLNSVEGFVRQIIGWREFVRGVYRTSGEKQRKKNFFKHRRRLPESVYHATTGVVPIDAAITKVLKSGYLHHIERLMVLGNFFLLCEIDPNEVYRWFMELFIDSYDWVMVPNVYGMSQYADGGMMTTKPYFSGSNYLLKMSDFKKGNWCQLWDALFWRFLIKHEDFFADQPRLQILSGLAKKKKEDRKLQRLAQDFLERLDTPSA